jgi:hypothetical protein
MRGGRVDYMFVIYHAPTHTGKTELSVQTRILKGGRAIFTGTPVPVQALEGGSTPGRIVTGGAFSVGSQIMPGEYTLQLTVADKLGTNDKRAIARQEIEFYVK